MNYNSTCKLIQQRRIILGGGAHGFREKKPNYLSSITIKSGNAFITERRQNRSQIRTIGAGDRDHNWTIQSDLIIPLTTGMRRISTFRSTTDCVYDSGPIGLYYNTYRCVTIAYSIQYSNMLYRLGAKEQQAILYSLGV
jgi:hypothetical protein